MDMKQFFLDNANAMAAELASLRQTIHQNPELGNQEKATADFIAAYLEDCDIRVTRLLDTAVMGELMGELPGPCVALRADMDGLPVKECTGVPYASKNQGIMHACGHDFHMAAVLGAARLLSQCRANLRGTVRFLFEPDEEGNGGAQRMIQAGCMMNPTVSAVFGAHVAPDLPAGTIGVRFGKFYAASDMFSVGVFGKSAHGATPEKGIDALAAAMEMITALKKLPKVFSEDKSVLSVGTFKGGTAGNVIADEATFSGILRTLGPETRKNMKELLQNMVDDIASQTKTQAQVYIQESYPGIINEDRGTELVHQVATGLFGESKVRLLSQPTMATEDFGYFIEAAGGGAFYHIGVGGREPLHSGAFLPEDSLLPNAAALHAAVIEAYLNGTPY